MGDVEVLERLSAEIAGAISDRWPSFPDEYGHPRDASCSLFVGTGGAVLVEADLYQATGEKSHRVRARRYADMGLRVLRDLPQGTNGGMVFGTAGLAWGLARLAEVTGEDFGLEYTLRHVVQCPTAEIDMSHGAAGRGCLFLRAYRILGDPYWRDLAANEGEQLVHSSVSNQAVLGFAHGLAGIGYFLHELAGSGHFETARSAAAGICETLLSSGHRVEGTLMWPHSRADAHALPHWCHGTAGVGLLLARARPDLRPLLERGAPLVVKGAFVSREVGICHGAAGCGEYLQELAALGTTTADEVGHIRVALEARAACMSGRIVWSGIPRNLEYTLGYGKFGIAHFVARCLDPSIPHPTLLTARCE